MHEVRVGVDFVLVCNPSGFVTGLLEDGNKRLFGKSPFGVYAVGSCQYMWHAQVGVARFAVYIWQGYAFFFHEKGGGFTVVAIELQVVGTQ